MQKGAIKPGQNVIVIDDLIATGSLQSTYFISKPFLKKDEADRSEMNRWIGFRGRRINYSSGRKRFRIFIHH